MNARTCNRACVLMLSKEGEDDEGAPKRNASELSVKLRNSACKMDVENRFGTVHTNAETRA